MQEVRGKFRCLSKVDTVLTPATQASFVHIQCHMSGQNCRFVLGSNVDSEVCAFNEALTSVQCLDAGLRASILSEVGATACSRCSACDVADAG
jgi:hypothetical protein